MQQSDTYTFLKLQFSEIKELEIGNLLNEDLERSRNSFLTCCFLTVLVVFTEVEKLDLGVAKLYFAEGGHNILVFFFAFASMALARYYWLNVSNAEIAKMTQLASLELTAKIQTWELEELEKQLSLARDCLDDEQSRVNVSDLEKQEILLKSQKTSLEKFRSDFEIQSEKVKILPKYIIMVGLFLVVLSLLDHIVFI
ncbi:hypothetical protein [Cognatishimia sp.]|uniref:hypothetical protein n=1 Tax=Cognatishimia sp. TaxID=2211648 RepID=UPI003516E49B|nr:hypothetical protein [Cognatishimia sp.]